MIQLQLDHTSCTDLHVGSCCSHCLQSCGADGVDHVLKLAGVNVCQFTSLVDLEVVLFSLVDDLRLASVPQSIKICLLQQCTHVHSAPLRCAALRSTPLPSTLHSTPLHSPPLYSTPLHSTHYNSTPLRSASRQITTPVPHHSVFLQAR